jgi:hypothetical protein
MPQHDLVIDNASGAAVRADLNNALAALGSRMKGPNAPPAPIAGMIWVDDDTPSATVWTVKQYDGADWIDLGRLDITANIYIPSEGVIAWADVASAATVDLGAQASRNLRITGTTTISSFGTAASGVRRELRFAGALTLTNSGSLILPGGANITTAAGDTATAISLGSGSWVVVDFQPAAGYVGGGLITNSSLTIETASLLGRVGAGTGAIQRIPLGNAAAALSLGINRGTERATTSGTAIDFTGIPAGVRRITINLNAVSTNGSNRMLLQIGAGSIANSGYSSNAGSIGNGANNTNSSGSVTSGFVLHGYAAVAAQNSIGSITLVNISGNTWICSAILADGTAAVSVHISGGVISLGGVLDRVRLTNVGGADTFDAGAINIFWEF